MSTNPAPEHSWSLSSKEVKALAHASGSDYVYALTEDEVSVNISPGTCSQYIHSKVQSSNTFLSHLSCSDPYYPPPSPHTHALSPYQYPTCDYISNCKQIVLYTHTHTACPLLCVHAHRVMHYTTTKFACMSNECL